LKLYLITTPDGMPVAWRLTDPTIGEREVVAEVPMRAVRSCALLSKLHLVRPDRREETPCHWSTGWIRQ
jgi:hypothetical protein